MAQRATSSARLAKLTPRPARRSEGGRPPLRRAIAVARERLARGARRALHSQLSQNGMSSTARSSRRPLAVEAIRSGHYTAVGATKYAAGRAEGIEKLEIGSHKVQHVAGRGGKLLTHCRLLFRRGRGAERDGQCQKDQELDGGRKEEVRRHSGRAEPRHKGRSEAEPYPQYDRGDAQKEIDSSGANETT